MLKKMVMWKGLVAAATLIVGAGAASAATVTADGTGTSSGSTCAFTCVGRYQQVYDSDLFTDSVEITSLSFVLAGLSGTSSSTLWSKFQVTLATAANNIGVGSLSTNFANNLSGDAETFATIEVNGLYSAGSLFTINGSFDYDPAQGDLIVDIKYLEGYKSNMMRLVSYSDPNTDGEFSHIYSFTSDNPVGVGEHLYGNHTIFNTQPIAGVPLPAVPLPASAWLLLGALGGLVSLSWRRKQRLNA